MYRYEEVHHSQSVQHNWTCSCKPIPVAWLCLRSEPNPPLSPTTVNFQYSQSILAAILLCTVRTPHCIQPRFFPRHRSGRLLNMNMLAVAVQLVPTWKSSGVCALLQGVSMKVYLHLADARPLQAHHLPERASTISSRFYRMSDSGIVVRELSRFSVRFQHCAVQTSPGMAACASRTFARTDCTVHAGMWPVRGSVSSER